MKGGCGKACDSTLPFAVTVISRAQFWHSQKHWICFPGGAPNGPASPPQYRSAERVRNTKMRPSCKYFSRAVHDGLAHCETIAGLVRFHYTSACFHRR